MRHIEKQGSTRSRIWTIFNNLREGRKVFGISGPALGSLQAILSFLPEGGSLVIYASNRSIIARSLKSEATLRRHLAELEACHLIARRRSSNGKRYRVRNPAGDDLIFGIDLAPLLGAEEAASRAAQEARDILALQRLHRNEAYVLLAQVAGQAEMAVLTASQRTIQPNPADIEAIRRKLAHMTDIDTLVSIKAVLLKTLNDYHETSGSPAQNERHIQESQKEYLLKEQGAEIEVGIAETHHEEELGKERGTPINQGQHPDDSKTRLPALKQRHLDIAQIVKACPEAMSFASEPVRSREDLQAFAWRLGTFIPIPENLMRQAAFRHGIETVTLTILGLVERSARIRNAAGYFRKILLGDQASSFNATRFATGAHAVA